MLQTKRKRKVLAHRRRQSSGGWPLSGLKFFNGSMITVLYDERNIPMYGCNLFKIVSRYVSSKSNRDVT
jgi:hypothetical protein